MQRMKSVLLSLLAVVFLVPAAFAGTFSINVAVTGDNLVSGWYQTGTGVITLVLNGNAANWRLAKTGTASGFQYGHTYSLIWQVVNDDNDSGFRAPSASNPGGFLAQLTGPFGTALSSASSGKWTYATQPNTVLSPTTYTPFNVYSLPLGFNDPSFQWQPVKAYGPNGGGADIWSSVLGGSVAGIDPNAQWIWSKLNFGDPGAPGMGTSVFIKYDLVYAPEPPLTLLLGIGAAMAGALWAAGVRKNGLAPQRKRDTDFR